MEPVWIYLLQAVTSSLQTLEMTVHLRLAQAPPWHHLMLLESLILFLEAGLNPFTEIGHTKVFPNPGPGSPNLLAYSISHTMASPTLRPTPAPTRTITPAPTLRRCPLLEQITKI